MNHIVSFSSGLSSAITSVRVLDKYPGAKLVFMDTLFEDESNYRFMYSFEKRFGVKIIRLVEGRNPYEVSHDEHVIPGSFLAPCTFRLKIEPFREYLKTLEGQTTIYIGYDFSEMHRCEATSKNYNALGYEVDYPLLWNPVEYRRYTDVVRSDWEIQPPRMYQLGYTHANCGGRCCKQGQGDWIRTLINFPDRFKEIETWENGMRQNEVNSNYAILKRQTIDGMHPLTLTELRERYEREHNEPTLFDAQSACVVCGIGGG
jgi:hypothetical protein